MTADDVTPVEIAVRGWTSIQTESEEAQKWESRSAIPPGRFRHALLLDVETRTDASQALTFGFCQHCIYLPDGKLVPVEEVCFYADELPETDPRGYAHLQEYVRMHPARAHSAPGYRPYRRTAKIALVSRTEFVRDYLLPLAAEAEACVIGFNLPFDLPRWAIGWVPGRGGGFTLRLEGNELTPRILVQKAGPKKAFVSWRENKKWKRGAHRGQFLDVSMLAFALTDRPHSLESVYRDFVGDDGGKTRPTEHGIITPEYIEYGRHDVDVTRLAAQEVLQEFYRHAALDISPARAYSPASISKSYRRAMGMSSLRERFPNFPDEIHGYAMSAFYGGRTEATIRRVPVPVGYYDFTSMYATVNTLMGLQDFHTRRNVYAVETPGTLAEYQALLDTITPGDCLDKQNWPRFGALGLVETDGDVLPVRAHYTEDSWQVALSKLAPGDATTGPTRLWYAMPDLIASKVLTGRAPRLLRVIRLQAVGEFLDTLRPVTLRGELELDPRRDNLSVKLVEQKAYYKELYKRSGDPRHNHLANSLKVLANSGEYGIFAEMNEQDGQKSTVTVHNHTGNSWREKVENPEKPGPMTFPPIAACITSGARLMLALLERLTVEAGGASAIRDTDASAIVSLTPEMQARLDGKPAGATFPDLPGVERTSGGRYLVACPGGLHRLSDGREAVRALTSEDMARIQSALNRLSPYDPARVPDLLTLDAEGWMYAVSSKRYTMFSYDKNGHPYLVVKRGENRARVGYDPAARAVRECETSEKDAHKYSEMVLGALTAPTGTGKEWIAEAWLRILLNEFGLECAEPKWYRYAVFTQYRVSSPYVMQNFAQWNEGLPYVQQVKPFNFLSSAQIAKNKLFEMRGGIRAHMPRIRPVTPYQRKPGPAEETEWFNLHESAGTRLSIISNDEEPGGLLLKGYEEEPTRLKNYRDVLTEHAKIVEAKFNGPYGEPCKSRTRGLLSRRTIRAHTIRTVGKESNSLEEHDALLVKADEPQHVYSPPERDAILDSAISIVQEASEGEIDKAISTVWFRNPPTSGYLLRKVANGQYQNRKPSTKNQQILKLVAVQLITQYRRMTKEERARAFLDADRTILDYMKERLTQAPTVEIELSATFGNQICPECSGTVHGKRVYCTDACRQTAYRRRRDNQDGR